MTKDTMRLYYSLMRAFPEKENQQTVAMVNMKRQLRKAQKENNDPLRWPLRNHFFSELAVCLPPSAVWRVHYTDWDSWKKYAIFADNGYSDEDIEEILKDEWVEIHSPYDCTGKPFTHYVHWKRCPAGIAVVVCMGLDV